ncbi:MAG: hypothetical protein U0271_28540 [Polyangiaceae bacterium]
MSNSSTSPQTLRLRPPTEESAPASSARPHEEVRSITSAPPASSPPSSAPRPVLRRPGVLAEAPASVRSVPPPLPSTPPPLPSTPPPLPSSAPRTVPPPLPSARERAMRALQTPSTPPLSSAPPPPASSPVASRISSPPRPPRLPRLEAETTPLPRENAAVDGRCFLVRPGERAGELVLTALPVGAEPPAHAPVVRLAIERADDARTVVLMLG